jgi:hypothetical protein
MLFICEKLILIKKNIENKNKNNKNKNTKNIKKKHQAIITLREKTLFRETRTINAFVRIINIFFFCVCAYINFISV